MRVEFLGLPGVGKSTLRRDLLKQLHRIDKEKYLSTEEAFLKIARSYIDNVYRLPLNFLPHYLGLKASKKLMNRSLMQFAAQNSFLADNGKALEAYFTSNAYYNMSQNDRANVIGSFLEMGSLWQSIDGRLQSESIVFYEEGFVQKSFMFINLSNGSVIEKEKLCCYLENIPLPDVVVYVMASIETCQTRMMERPDGLTERLKSADRNDVVSFLNIAQNHLNFVTKWLDANSRTLTIEVNSENDLQDASPEVIKKIQGLME